ncbi:MAG: hypothetical protein NT001_06090 [Candidatus Woesearchaeota archaeon]|nr:hypothetical protein [Candidatus Woesearchaeota archaeon]
MKNTKDERIEDRMIKKIFLIASAVIMLIMVSGPACATYDNTVSVSLEKPQYTQDIQVLTLKYDPYPVGPGEYFDLWLKLGNEESADIDDLAFELVPEYPFSIDKSEIAQRNFGKIYANSIVLVHYKVRVDEGALDGVTPIKFRYRYVQSNLKWIEGQENILIQTREAVLNVVSVSSDPETIPPGKEAMIKITVKNQASSVIRDVLFNLDLSMSTVAKNPATMNPTSTLIDSYYNSIPLVPINSSSQKMVGYIGAGEEKEIIYHVRAMADAKAKVYKVPIRMTYHDSVGSNYTKDDVIGIVIGDVPDVSAYITDNTVYNSGATGTVSIKFVNKGATDAKFFNVVLKQSDNYDIISSDNVYIGSLDSDDYETADFKINVKKLKSGKLNIPVHFEFKDANGNDYSRDANLELVAYSTEERGQGGNGSLTSIIVVLIILAAGWLIYRKWEKGRKKNARKEKA